MAIHLNHIIVPARDSERSARFLAELLGLPAPTRMGPFVMVQTENGVSLDFQDTDEDFLVEHYAFLVSEDEFDGIFGRMREQGLPYWADPGRTESGQINRNDGGRGVYLEDPDGHVLELLTRPYGSGGSA